MIFALSIKTAEDSAAEALAAQRAQITTEIDILVEAQAREIGYTSAVACAGYRDSTVPEWSAEARAFIAWRDAVWQAAFVLFSQSKDVPSIEALTAKLPIFGA